MVRRFILLLGFGLTIGCQPDTTRPAFAPLPESAGTEIRLSMREATRQLAQALRTSGVPVRKVMLRDGYLESGWFNSKSGRPTSRRPLGTEVVRVRAWADPSRPGSSQVTVETSYRPLADPSLPDRELERQVPHNHPVAVKVEKVLQQLVERYGGAPIPQTAPPATKPDSLKKSRV
jgi:hypothetical protein